jgi:hypothetical protein
VAVPRSTQRQLLRGALGLPQAGSGLLGHEALEDILDEAWRKFSGQRLWPWLRHTATVTVSSTDGRGDLPAGFVQASMVTVTVDDSTRIAYKAESPEEFVDTQRPSWSCVWFVIGSELALSPTPTDDLDVTLWYYRLEPLMEDDNETPLAPDHAVDAVLAWACALGETRRGNREAIAAHEARFDRLVADLADETFRGPAKRKIVPHRDKNQWAVWS